MRHISAKHIVTLVQIAIVWFSLSGLNAATAHDTEIELSETTYRVGAGNTAEITYHQRWKANTAQGRDAIRQVHISYIASFHDVEFRSIKTIKKDGSVVSGDPKGAFDTAPATDAGPPSYTDEKIRTVLAPNVETGDSIEYEAVLHIHKWPKSGEFWFTHDLVQGIPIHAETVVLDLPADRKIAVYESAAIPGKVENVSGRRVERWTTSRPEPGARTIEEAPPLFAVSSITSWDDFGAWIRSLNENAGEPTQEIVALAKKLIANKTTEMERITALYTYVATKIRYIGVSFDIGRIQPHTPSAVLHNAFGDCKDQTALLSALLTAAGFKTHAVLTAPGVGVRLPGVPSPDQFNHEFTAVETKSGLMFLDTVMGPVPPQVMATGVRGLKAFMVGDPSLLIEIPSKSPVPSRVTSALQGRITAAGVFDGSIKLELQGSAELGLRRTFLDASDADKEKLLRELAGPEFKNATVRQIANSDPDDLGSPLKIQCELSDREFFPVSKAALHLGSELPNSPAASYGAMAAPAKPFLLEELLVTSTLDVIVDTALTTVNGMPVHLKTDFGSFDSEYSYDRGHQKLSRSIVLKGTSIAPSDWKTYAEFMQAIIREEARGFSLERHIPSRTSTVSGISNLTLQQQEGAAAFQRRDYAASIRAYLQVTKLDPKNPFAWNNLGRAYAARREYDKAEQAYKQQIQLNPKDLYAYNNLGVVYRNLRREDEAIECFLNQIAVSPRDPYAHDNLAVSLGAKNQWGKARDESAIAAEISPTDPVKWFRLGKAQIKTGQLEQGRQSFEKSLALVHDASTENNIAYELADAGLDLDKASQLISGTLTPEATQVCEPEKLSREDKCAAQLKRIVFMIDTAGWVLYRQGKLREAEPYLTASRAISPRAENAIHLSILFAKSERVDEALKYFADASSYPDYARMDKTEARKELAQAIGDEAQVDSRLRALHALLPLAGTTARVLALVDANGKVLDAQPEGDNAPSALIEETKSLMLPPISWPGHSIRSIRTLEFRRDGAPWSLFRSSVGILAEPLQPADR